MTITIGTRVHHPDCADIGTVVELGQGYQDGRARVKWDDRTWANGYLHKGKRTWIALNRLALAR